MRVAKLMITICLPGRYMSSFSPSKTAIFYYNDIYKVVLPSNHQFPMEKYALVRQGLQSRLNSRDDISFIESPVATSFELGSTHCPLYIERFLSGNLSPKENRKIGFPWSPSGVLRSLSSVGGTVAAMRSVCSGECLIAGHIAGGTHHAFYDYGEGFCVFSDIAVASNLALKEFQNIVSKILIIDLDVHQGNGNAVLFRDNENVFTFSMHCTANYFSAKQISDFDVEVEPGTGDDEYMNLLQTWLPQIMNKVKPQLVFYQAGVDISEMDRLGKLKLTQNGISNRNKFVYKLCKEYDSKVVITMGGG